MPNHFLESIIYERKRESYARLEKVKQFDYLIVYFIFRM